MEKHQCPIKIDKTVDCLLGCKEGEYMDIIIHVTDSNGHDMRYDIDSNKFQRELL